ncbi:hypothetical protein HK097_005032, partial [Rhizophlyctis rosea]
PRAKLEGEVERSNDLLSQKKLDASTLRSALTDDDGITALTSQIQSLESQISTLTHDRDSRILELTDQISSLNQQHQESVTSLIKSFETEKKNLADQLSEATTKVSELEMEVEMSKSLVEEVENLKSELEGARGRVGDLQGELESGRQNVEGEVEELRKRVRELEGEVEEYKTMVEDAERFKAELESVRGRVAEMENEIGQKVEEGERLKEELENARLAVREREWVEKELESATEKVGVLDRDLRVVEGDRDEARGRVGELERELEKVRQEVAKFSEESRKAEEGRSSAEQNLESLLANVAKYLDRLSTSEDVPAEEGWAVDDESNPIVDERLQEGLEKVRGVLKGLRTRVGDAEAALRKWTERDRNLEGDREKEAESLEEARREAERVLEGVKNDYEIQLSSLRGQISQLTKEKEEKEESERDLRGRCEALMAEVDRVETERRTVAEKLATVKEAVKGRLKEEVETAQKLRHENETQKTELQTLRTSSEQLRAKLHTLQTDLTKTHVELETTRNTLQKTESEKQRLQSHLLEIEESANLDLLSSQETLQSFQVKISSLQSEISSLQSELSQSAESLRLAVEERDKMEVEVEVEREETKRLEAIVREREVALENLQGALESFQRVKEREIEFECEGLRRECERWRRELEGVRERAERAEAKLVKMDKAAPQVQQLQQELAEKNAVVGKLRHDVIQVQTHLAEAMRRMRDAAGSDENVDRRLITNLVVSFLAAPRGDAKRFEILNVIGSVLRFSEEERYKVGLARKPPGWGLLSGVTGGGGGAAPAAGGGEGGDPAGTFTDMWISFLLKESTKGPGVEDAPPPPQAPSLVSTPSSSSLPILDSRRGSVEPSSAAPPVGRERKSSFGFFD